MFSEVKAGDTVLVSVPGDRAGMYEKPETFLIPMQVKTCTPARFTIKGVSYKKKDGYSYPSGNGYCLPHEENKDESSKLQKYNVVAGAVNDINNHLYSFGKLRVKRNIANLHTILKQAEILAALIKAGSK